MVRISQRENDLSSRVTFAYTFLEIWRQLKNFTDNFILIENFLLITILFLNRQMQLKM
jgi:hypothetical protein